ncbi:SPOR domain-containing protein [Tateyamaria sp.]|uniref:SPOR domain-containing protein n=1 Tax=Tateyamaria sp. TaxID=1929288 RepID=UPI0032A10A0C
MADMNYSHDLGHVGYADSESTSSAPSNPLRKFTNIAGAVTSLALIGGVAVWGYQLVVRDVSGIPVVRATAGEMRVRPENPGGQLAQNTGLAVNAVAAAGEAAGPVDSVILAPKPVELSLEDQPMQVETVAPVQQPEPLPQSEPVQQPAPLDVATSLDATPVAPVDAAAERDVDEIVRQLIEGAKPIDAETVESAPVVTSLSAPDAAETTAVITGPGPKQSHRPQLRPRNASTSAASAAAPTSIVSTSATTATSGANELDAATIPAGTRLVQLGAFDSPDIARAQWEQMQHRFGDYLAGKERIVQTAESGGRTFYRLRAHGFADLSEARRFCSALVAEGAECIPVVTR